MMIALGFNSPAFGGASVVSGAVGFHFGPCFIACLVPFVIVVAVLGLCRIVVTGYLRAESRRSRARSERRTVLAMPQPPSRSPRLRLSGESPSRLEPPRPRRSVG